MFLACIETACFPVVNGRGWGGWSCRVLISRIARSFNKTVLRMCSNVYKSMSVWSSLKRENVDRVVACSQAVVSGWAWTASPSLHVRWFTECVAWTHTPPPSCCCFLLECTPPFPEWPGFPLVPSGGQAAAEASQRGSSSGEPYQWREQPMTGSTDGREAGGCLVGGLLELWRWGQGDAVLLAGKWGWALEGVWPWVWLSMVRGPSLAYKPALLLANSQPHPWIKVKSLSSSVFGRWKTYSVSNI